jgi:hypothetical protein
MHVRLLRHWQGHKPGRVFAEMPDGAANCLIRRGIAELGAGSGDPRTTDTAAEAQDARDRGTSRQDAESAPGRRRRK